MKHYKVTCKGKNYKVTARDSISAIVAVMRLRDDRLSPMTYSKLKELGYSSEDWKKLNQEQANAIVAKGRKTEENSSQNKGEKENIVKNNIVKSKSSSTVSKQPNPKEHVTNKVSTKNVNNMMNIMSDNDWMWNLAVNSDFEDVNENYIEEMKYTYFEETGKEISDDELKYAFKKMRKAYEEE